MCNQGLKTSLNAIQEGAKIIFFFAFWKAGGSWVKFNWGGRPWNANIWTFKRRFPMNDQTCKLREAVSRAGVGVGTKRVQWLTSSNLSLFICLMPDRLSPWSCWHSWWRDWTQPADSAACVVGYCPRGWVLGWRPGEPGPGWWKEWWIGWSWAVASLAQEVAVVLVLLRQPQSLRSPHCCCCCAELSYCSKF